MTTMIRSATLQISTTDLLRGEEIMDLAIQILPNLILPDPREQRVDQLLPTTAAKPTSIPSQTPPVPVNSTNVRIIPKVGGGQGGLPVGQRIVVPAGTVQRLMVVSASDGRKMVAVRPVSAVSVVNTSNNFTNTISTNK